VTVVPVVHLAPVRVLVGVGASVDGTCRAPDAEGQREDRAGDDQERGDALPGAHQTRV
jgi:hypothetical protein